MRTIKSVCAYETRLLQAGVYWTPTYLRSHYHYQLNLQSEGWRFMVVGQTRGHCFGTSKIITIPLWCIKRAINKDGQGRLVQYILHEIAHALDLKQNGSMCGHKKPFMDILIKICPKELLVYEMTYKPRALVSAGAIFCPDSLNF